MTVVGQGVRCDIDDHGIGSPGSALFLVREFAVLADGRRLTLSSADGGPTGFGLSMGGLDPWPGLTPVGLTGDVLTTVLPDDDTGEDAGEDHPWTELAGRLRTLGVEVTAEQLRSLPYEVEFSDRLRARLPSR